MAEMEIGVINGRAKVVGSFGSLDDLLSTNAVIAESACELVEIRLDLLASAQGGGEGASNWRHLRGMPMLFTARRRDEGGAHDFSASQRMELLRAALDDAACVDIEVASMGEMADLIGTLRARGIPWVASFHDFQKLPDTATLEKAVQRAKEAGADMFKVAAKLCNPGDLARLADFQLNGHGIPKSCMGMGALAPVSRLLCAQCGSEFNYGYLGKTATAPGQWDAALLKEAISRLVGL